MMTMTTSTANHTPPRHPTTTTHPSKSPSTREVSTAPKSDVRRNRNKSSHHSTILCESPTTISPNHSNDAVVDSPVDDNERHPQPSECPTTAPDPTLLQERNDFIKEFDDFYLEVRTFRDEYLYPRPYDLANAASHYFSNVHDNDERQAHDSNKPRNGLRELEEFNYQFFQFLEQLENTVPQCTQPSLDPFNNPQQPAPCPAPQRTQIPRCVTTGEVPPAPNPTPNTVVPGELNWPAPSITTTIPNEMDVSDSILPQLPPPAPDPDTGMFYDSEPLWPPPRPALKTIPLKKKYPTKHTIERRNHIKDSLRQP